MTDRPAVASGIAVALLGGLLALDQAGAVGLDFAWAASAVLAVLGVLLVAAGLSGSRRR